MDFKVGVFAEGSVSEEIMTEAKQALQEIALKYQVRFELTKGTIKEKKSDLLEGKSRSDSRQENGTYLSFGGELEL